MYSWNPAMDNLKPETNKIMLIRNKIKLDKKDKFKVTNRINKQRQPKTMTSHRKL